MVIKRKEDIITDRAWEHLYDRLKRDGLLCGKTPGKALRKTVPFVRTAAAVVAILLAGLCSVLYVANRPDAPGRKRLVLHNEANAPTLATMLHDGSVVYLSEQTSLTYPDRFDENRREVTLNGEAFFEICGNGGCPFFIDTDLATVEVTGTAFSVKSKDRSSFSLSVRDGEVRVSLKAQQQTVAVKAGETVSLDAERQLLSKTNHHRVAGRFGRIHFKDEQLGNIVSIINAHSDSIRMEIDPELESRLLTMPVSLENNLSETAEIICLVLNLQYSRKDCLIRISKKE
jgi:ferric-dicitrate binding protein FerR (iron transport regulator)